MRKFAFFTLLCSLLAGCVKDEFTGTLSLSSDDSLIVDAEGGVIEIGYTLGGASDYENLTAESNAEWISDIEVGKSVRFTVAANELTDSRVTVLMLSYGSQTASVNIFQKGYKPPYDVDFEAHEFNGTYYGKVGTTGFNYTLILSDVGVPTASNQYYGSKLYYLDIYSDVTAGFTTDSVAVPEGIYEFDNGSTGVPGTMAANGSYYVAVSENGAVESRGILSGSVTVSKDYVEAMLFLDDGQWHRVTYSGNVVTGFDYLEDVKRPYSHFKEDYSFDVKSGYIRAYYRGDYYGLGYDVWYISMIEKKDTFSGLYLTFDIFVDSGLGYKEDAFLGEYTACNVAEGAANTFIPGRLRNAFEPLNSWALWCNEALTSGDWGGPIDAGTIRIERDGNDYSFIIDCKDDAGKAVKGKFSGILGEYRNQCPELDADDSDYIRAN